METGHERIIIVGAGLVGIVLAAYLTRHGYQVEVYDKNADLLDARYVSKRSSINLTLCERGLRPLDAIGVGPIIRSRTIPVYGRLIHDLRGNLTYQSYGQKHQALYSVLREDLNKILLRFVRENYHAAFHFNQKCAHIDLETNTITFIHTETGEVASQQADIIFGADGAFSAVRSSLQRTACFNYSQMYMEYGYKELTIQQPKQTGWITQKEVIHFWPRGDYMLMGFYNVDGSFTLSLHLPFEGENSFASIATKEDLLAFFAANFPDVTDQISNLTEVYFRNSINSMITIRCNPWSYQDRVALIGDAVHAIVPYYGQGANSGFEDCAILDQCIQQYRGHWRQVFREYERLRKPNTEVIADLALLNFVELRDRMSNPQFQLRKTIETRLQERYPDRYTTLYSMIAFSSLPFVDAIRIDRDNRLLVDRIMATPGIEHLPSDELDLVIDAVIQESAMLTSA